MSPSIKTVARIAGCLYLINIVFGFFAIGYVPSVVYSKDIYLSAEQLVLDEQMFRLGLTAHLIILLTNIPLAVIFWKLFKPVNKSITLLVILFTTVGTAVEACNLLNEFMQLVVLTEKQYASVFTTPQLASLVSMFHRLQVVGVNLAFIFFGCYGICIGFLIARSTFINKFIGPLMVIGGSCYLFNSFVSILAPEIAKHLPGYILIPAGLGELILCIYFLKVGVNVNKWEGQLRKTSY